MLSTQSLREQLNRYAEGSSSIEAVEEWLASESWDMRRWAPRGLQRLVESLQSIFIRYSDGKMSPEELHELLIARRDQLGRAQQVTAALEQNLAIPANVAVQQPTNHPNSLSRSQALTVPGPGFPERRLAMTTKETAIVQALVDKLDVIVPIVDGYVVMTHIRSGGQYTGPNLIAELAAVKELVAAQASPEQRDRIVRWLRECQELLAEPTEVPELEELIAALVPKDAEP